MEIISLSGNKIFSYIDGKLNKTLTYTNDNQIITNKLYKISDSKVLLNHSHNKSMTIDVDTNNVTNININNHDAEFRNLYHNLFVDIFTGYIIDMDYSKIIGTMSGSRNTYVPHVDFNANLIEDFAAEQYINMIYIRYPYSVEGNSVENKEIYKLAVFSNITLIACIDKMFIYKVAGKYDTIEITISDPSDTNTELINSRNNTTWSIKDIFSANIIEKLPDYNTNIDIFYTSVPIISYTIFVEKSNILYVALIRFMDYDNIDVEEHVIENIWDRDDKFLLKGAELNDVDDYGFAITVESYTNEHYWIYRSRNDSTTYRGEGYQPLINSKNYKKKLNELTTSSINIFEPLKNIINSYI